MWGGLLEQEGHSRAVCAVGFHPDGSLAALGGQDAIGVRVMAAAVSGRPYGRGGGGGREWGLGSRSLSEGGVSSTLFLTSTFPRGPLRGVPSLFQQGCN